MWEPPSMNGDVDDFDLSSGNTNAVSTIYIMLNNELSFILFYL